MTPELVCTIGHSNPTIEYRYLRGLGGLRHPRKDSATAPA
jgi:hypothetical protein